MKSSVPHSSWILVFAFAPFFTSLVTSYSPGKHSYFDHCNSIVPEALPTEISLEPSPSFFFFTDHFSGGHKLLSQDTAQRAFSLSPNDIVYTRTPGVLKLKGTLYLHSGRGRMTRSASLDLSGFWSEHKGKLCMVGSGSGESKQGQRLSLSAVFKLDLPKISNISSSLVAGTIESLDPVHSPNYFDSISMVIYSQIGYEYTLIPQVKDSCQKMGGDEEDFLVYNFEYYFCGNIYMGFELEGKSHSTAWSSAPFAGASKMSLSKIGCSRDGKFRFHIVFWNPTDFGYNEPLHLNRTLVGEGFWDRGKNRVCFMGCSVITSGDSLEEVSVGDCKIGFSLWFPTVLSLTRRSSPVGNIWSDHIETDPAYFGTVIGFRGVRKDEVPSSSKYNYTVLDVARELHLQKEKEKDRNSMKRMFPDGVSFKGMKFEFDVKNSAGIAASGYAVPLFIDEQFYIESYAVNSAFMPRTKIDDHCYCKVNSSVMPRRKIAEENRSVLNVSYSIRYQLLISLSGEIVSKEKSIRKEEYWVKEEEIAAEGIYNAERGMLYMVGCRSVGSLLISDESSVDCNIVIEIQIPPSDSEHGENFDGRIWSTREKPDTLFFEPWEISSRGGMTRREQIGFSEMAAGVAVAQIRSNSSL